MPTHVETFMRHLALSFALVTGLAAADAADARDGASYDGTWQVELITESGLCDARYSTSLSVTDGQVRPVSGAASGSATVSGRIGPAGQVGLTLATAAANGTASGKLGSQAGNGRWSVSALCSGRWTATRRTTRTASAE